MNCNKCGKAMTYYGGTKEDGPFFYCDRCDKVIFINPFSNPHN